MGVNGQDILGFALRGLYSLPHCGMMLDPFLCKTRGQQSSTEVRLIADDPIKKSLYSFVVQSMIPQL